MDKADRSVKEFFPTTKAKNSSAKLSSKHHQPPSALASSREAKSCLPPPVTKNVLFGQIMREWEHNIHPALKVKDETQSACLEVVAADGSVRCHEWTYLARNHPCPPKVGLRRRFELVLLKWLKEVQERVGKDDKFMAEVAPQSWKGTLLICLIFFVGCRSYLRSWRRVVCLHFGFAEQN